MAVDDLLAVLPIASLSLWACALLLVEAFLPARAKPAVPWLAVVGLALSLGLVIAGPAPLGPAYGGMVMVDGFGRFLQGLFLTAGLLGVPLAIDYSRRRGIARGEYHALLLFSVAGMMLMAVANDLIIVFLALEWLSIPLYVLAAFAWKRAESEESGMKYFLLGAFASAFLVYGTALVYGAAGTTNLGEVLAAFAAGKAATSLLAIGSALVLVGIGFKVAAVPFHMWTPDVYHGAPTSAVAFMAVGAKAAGFSVLLRLALAGLPWSAPAWTTILGGIAGLTMIWGNVAAIAQTNIKRLLAYSSIAHAGYLMLGVVAGAAHPSSPSVVEAVLFYLSAYTVTTLGAWAVVLVLEREDGAGTEIEDYAGLAQRRPWVALAMGVFMLSLIGVPPTLGFLGKFFVFGAALESGLIGLAVVGVLTSLASAYYYLRVVVTMFMRSGDPQTHPTRWVTAAIGLTAVVTLVLGLVPGPVLDLASRAVMAGVLR